MHLHRLRSILLALALAPIAIGCGDAGGDDGDDSGAETEAATGSTGSADTNTTPGETSDPPSTTGESATTDASGDTTGGSATDDGATDTGAATDDGATDTGSMGACAELAMEDCDADEACVWVGNPNAGTCYPAGAEACAEIMQMQACQQHPDCEWSNQEGTCGAPM